MRACGARLNWFARSLARPSNALRCCAVVHEDTVLDVVWCSSSEHSCSTHIANMYDANSNARQVNIKGGLNVQTRTLFFRLPLLVS